MSSVNVSKSVLSSPNQIESEVLEAQAPSPAATCEQVLSHIKFEHKIEQSLKQSQKEAHQKRLQSLRKELDFLNTTAWQFEQSDKSGGNF